MAAQVDMPRHRRAASAGKRRELVDVAGLNRSGDPRHHLAADEVMFATIGREYIHAARAGEPANDRHCLLAAHLNRVQYLVWKVRWLLRGPSIQGPGLETEHSGPGRKSGNAQERSSVAVAHRASLHRRC